MKLHFLSVLLALAPLHGFASGGLGNEIDVYYIGNSLTRQLSLDRLEWLFQQDGGRMGYGSQGAANCPLYAQYSLTRDGKPLRTGNIESKPYGNYPNALATAKFDALILQPHQQWLESDPANDEGAPGDVEVVGKFIDFALRNNPAKHTAVNCFYIFGCWPELLGIHYRNPATTGVHKEGEGYGTSYTGFTFADFYASPYTRDVFWNQPRQTVATRDFYNRLITSVNEHYKNLPKPVRLIPGGDVLAELDRKIREGKLPGIEAYFTRPANAAYYAQARAKEKGFPIPAGTPFDARYGVVNFYTDRFHFADLPHNSPEDGTIGGYVTSLTIFSALSGRNPVGLPATANGKGWQRFDAGADAALIRALQETVWEVVGSDPLSGVKP